MILQQLILQTREKQAVTLSEVQWLGKTLAVKQEKIRTFLLSVQDMQANDSPKISYLEKLLFECRDCLQLLREGNAEKTSIFYYLTYLRLHLTCRRNLQLIKTLKNPSDLVRPYEILIGSLGEISALPLEQHFPATDAVESFRGEIEAQILVYKAYRCYYVGNVAKSNWKESVALLQRASQYCNNALNNEHVSKVKK